jgi:hypothetical protein
VLREQLSCVAMDLTPSPFVPSLVSPLLPPGVNIDGTAKPGILAQVGHFYFGAVGQYYFGGDKLRPRLS